MTEKHHHLRGSFSGQLGFILAAAASAVGLGNLWRFPYLAAKYGGGAFLVTYIILVVTFGFTLMMAEVALGRHTRLSTIGAYKKFGKKYSIIGILGTIVPIIITPYYCVIGGWILKYLYAFVSGDVEATTQDGYFGAFISQPVSPLIWTWIFVLFCGVVVFNGIKNGIERLNRFLMPALIIISVVICIYSISAPGAVDGLKYYLIPHFENFGVKTIVAAMGQMFFSLSLAMGIMVTYGSYMRKEDNLERSIGFTELFDTGIAFLAGLMIVPAVFAFSGGEATAVNAGPGLMFITLPKVFNSLPMPALFGALFFILVFFAASTSAISLYETIVSIIMDHYGMERKKASVIAGIGIAVVGIAPSLGFGLWGSASIAGMSILDIMDFVSNSVLMPIVALLTCLFIGWWKGPQLIIDEVGPVFRRKKLFLVMVRWVAPVLLVVIFVAYVLSSLGIISL